MLSLKTLQDYCIHERVRETREARSQRLFFRTPWFLLLFKTSFTGLKINGLTRGFPFFGPTPMIHLSLPPQQWGYKHASPHPALFMWPVRIELRPSSLCGKHFITWVISLTHLWVFTLLIVTKVTILPELTAVLLLAFGAITGFHLAATLKF